jgi:hypothetical protein
MVNLLQPVLLFLYGLLMCGMPLSRMMVGSIPLYFVDVLAFVLFLFAWGRMSAIYASHRKLSIVALILVLSLLPTTFDEYFRIGFLEPSYLLGRAILHITMLWALPALLRQRGQWNYLLLGVAIGILVTASVAILNSLPVTGPWMRAHIFTISWLKPTGDYFELSSELMMLLDKGEAERGNSLIGQSNITGCVIVTMIPFLVGMLRNVRLGVMIKLLLQVVVAMALFAVLFTYSRSNYLALALLITGYLLFDRQAFSRRFLPIIILAAVVFAVVGVQSTLFKFDFIASKFDLGNEQYQENNQARILSYTRPLQLVLRDPTFLFRGAGRTFRKVDDPNAGILNLTEQKCILQPPYSGVA